MSSPLHRFPVTKGAPSAGEADTIERPRLEPIDTSFSFKNKAYAALKSVIVGMDVYGSRREIRLDERSLAQDFGISRTPVREAMAQLEREGFVRSVPRRGIYVVRKTRREVIELITAWAALESMAARLITENASDDEIASLRKMFATFENGASARSSRRIFGSQYRVPPDHHPALPQQRADGACRKSVYPYADDPAKDDRREGSRRPLDPRPHTHHRGVGGARHRARRRRWCAIMRSASPSTSRNTPIIWTEYQRGGHPHG